MSTLDSVIIERPLRPFVVFTGVLFLDQLLKHVFLIQDDFQKNFGALFGWKLDYFWAFLALTILCGLIHLNRCPRKGVARSGLSFALIFSGVVSNLLDRIRFGFIIDYIHFFAPFVFNLADLALLLGAGLLIWNIIEE